MLVPAEHVLHEEQAGGDRCTWAHVTACTEQAMLASTEHSGDAVRSRLECQRRQCCTTPTVWSTRKIAGPVDAMWMLHLRSCTGTIVSKRCTHQNEQVQDQLLLHHCPPVQMMICTSTHASECNGNVSMRCSPCILRIAPARSCCCASAPSTHPSARRSMSA